MRCDYVYDKRRLVFRTKMEGQRPTQGAVRKLNTTITDTRRRGWVGGRAGGRTVRIPHKQQSYSYSQHRTKSVTGRGGGFAKLFFQVPRLQYKYTHPGESRVPTMLLSRETQQFIYINFLSYSIYISYHVRFLASHYPPEHGFDSYQRQLIL